MSNWRAPVLDEGETMAQIASFSIPVTEARATVTPRFFDRPLSISSRITVLVAALLLVPVYFFPLYRMTLFSNNFTDGLNLNIYAGSLRGDQSANRDDLKEINSLNHYIGMHPLEEADFSEFQWIPLMLGFFILLSLRAAIMGKMSALADTLVAFGWFGLFALWHFYQRLYTYGHNLDPSAAVKVKPFTPPVFGSAQIANFTVYNYPAVGTYLMAGFVVLLSAAVVLSMRAKREARS
jgi:copper chaperone NosL